MSNVGFRVFKKIHRPDPALIEKYRGMPVANIGDVMNSHGVSRRAHQALEFRPSYRPRDHDSSEARRQSDVPPCHGSRSAR